jgi:hypothetical protein
MKLPTSRPTKTGPDTGMSGPFLVLASGKLVPLVGDVNASGARLARDHAIA